MERILALDFPEVVENDWLPPRVKVVLPSSIAAMTLCLQLLIPFYTRSMSAILFQSSRRTVFSLEIELDWIIVTVAGQSYEIPVTIIPGFWSNLCLPISFTNSTLSLFLNDKEKFELKLNETDVSQLTGEIEILIGCGTYETERKDMYYLFFGQISNMHIWNRQLSAMQMRNATGCQYTDRDLIYSWDPSGIIVNDTSMWAKIKEEDMCRPTGEYSAVLSPPLPLSVAESICSLLKGRLKVYGTPEEEPVENSGFDSFANDDVEIFTKERKWKIINKYRQKFDKFKANPIRTGRDKMVQSTSNQKYIAANPSRLRGNVRIKRSSSEKLLVLNTVPEKEFNLKSDREADIEPDQQTDIEPTQKANIEPGLQTDMEPDQELFFDSEWPSNGSQSELSFRTVCYSDEPLLLRVNGFCVNLLPVIEERFVLIGRRTGFPMFQGFNGKQIIYVLGKWIASHPNSTTIELWFEDSIYNPTMSPMGRKLWLIMVFLQREVPVEEVYLPCDLDSIYLNLSPCSKEHFTCSDGTCLPLSMRCDRKGDCSDASDEEFCYKLFVPDGKDRNIAPKPVDGESLSKVHLHLTIITANFNLDKLVISMKTRITWKDPDFTLYNLQNDRLANLLDDETFEEIWVPSIMHGRSLSNKLTIDNDSDIFMVREESGVLEDYEFSWEGYEYKGSKAPLQTSQTFTVEVKCSLNPFLFPFGLQRCVYPFTLASGDSNFIDLSIDPPYGGVEWKDFDENIQYAIKDVYFRRKNDSLHSTQEFIVEFHPRLGLAIVTLFFPSLIFVAISYLSFHFSIGKKELRLTIAIFPLLGLSILQTQVGTRLLDNTSVKASDIWLFGAFGIIFSIIVANTFLSKENPTKPMTAKKIAPIESSLSALKLVSKTQELKNMDVLLKKLRFYFPLCIFILVIFYLIFFITLCTSYNNSL